MSKRERKRLATASGPKGLSKRLAAEFADGHKRCGKHIDDAITATALQLYFTKDEIAKMLPATIELWNTTADQIEREFGKGWFPIRLGHSNAFSFAMGGTHDDRVRAMVRLDYLAARTEEDPTPFRLMHDLTFMAEFAPEVRIQREAGPRNSTWHRRLRKTKENKALYQAKLLADALSDIKENTIDPFWQDVRQTRKDWERNVRKDDSYALTLPASPEQKPLNLASEPPAPFKPRWERRPPIDPVADAMKERTGRARKNRAIGEALGTIRPPKRRKPK